MGYKWNADIAAWRTTVLNMLLPFFFIVSLFLMVGMWTGWMKSKQLSEGMRWKPQVENGRSINYKA